MRERTFGGDPQVVRIITGHFDARPGYRVVRPDGTSSWLITLTLAGVGRLGRLEAHPGEIVLIRPRTPHDYGVPAGSSRWDFVWAHFHPLPHWTPWLAGAPERKVAASARVRERFAEMHAVVHAAHGEDLALNALEEVLIRTAERVPTSPIDPRVAAVIDRIRGDLTRPWDATSLASEIGLSPSRLAHLFRAETHEPLGRFVERERLDRARRLLEASALSVTQIAEACGFPNVYYFSLRFKKANGIPPSEYRKALGH